MGMQRKLDLLPKITAGKATVAHRDVAQWKFPRRRRRKDFYPPVERGVFTAVDQSVYRFDDLGGETLHADRRLGQKAAINGNSRLHSSRCHNIPRQGVALRH